MDTVLRRLQLTQLEILKAADEFCRKHGIKYSLYAGSLLGAVRHQGFIPWDDDLDICMARSEYERFLSAWASDPQDGYVLQNKETERGFSQSFTKIRKEHTCFLQDIDDPDKYYTGIFLDVFPIDRLPEKALKRKLFRWDCLRYQLLTREFVPPKGSFVQKTVARAILMTTPKRKRPEIRKKYLARITRYKELTNTPTIAIETFNTIRCDLPSDLLDRYTTLRFEDGEYMCFEAWDEYLTHKYGDYMQLPPEEDRAWKHHPILIDFERGYDEIAKENRTSGAVNAEGTNSVD